MEPYKDLPGLSDYDSDDEDDFDIVADFIAEKISKFAQTQPPIKQHLECSSREHKHDFGNNTWGVML